MMNKRIMYSRIRISSSGNFSDPTVVNEKWGFCLT